MNHKQAPIKQYDYIEKRSIYRGTVFEVSSNSDLTEGRGVRVSLGFCATKEIAKEFGTGKGVMGSQASITEIRTEISVPLQGGGMMEWENTKVINTFPLIFSYENPELLKRRALAKLTPAEIAALGIKV